MNDFGAIEHQDVFHVGNPFDDFQLDQLDAFQFDLLDGDLLNSDDLLISDVVPSPTEKDQSDQPNLYGEIEQFLLSDFDSCVGFDQQQPPLSDAAADAFLSDLFIDSPPPPPVEPGSGSSSTSDASIAQFPYSAQASDTNQNDVTHQNDDSSHDCVGKKRDRQLRNRDAAVRSRERKKMYVKDLELKSRYFEAECKRLGMVLQCCLAENQALKFSLQTSGAAFAASATKQESAVLLLESLLLGSLLWFLGIKDLFFLTLLLLLLPIQKTAVPPQVGVVGGKSRESPIPRKIQINKFGASIYRFSMMNKKWRGSRTRMKKGRFLSAFKSLFVSIDPGFGIVGGVFR